MLKRLLQQISSLKDEHLLVHQSRVMLYGGIIAYKTYPELAEVVIEAASVHDVGKIGVPDQMLFKDRKLNNKEWGIIKQHPVTGADLISRFDDMQHLEEVVKAVRHHHERWDGKGYPDKLKGEDIPLASRILAIADTLDAITSNRPYRSARDFDTAIAEIRKNSGTQFDPKLVEALEKIIPLLHK